MNFSITGGSGFIGRRIVTALSQQGHNVTVLSRRTHSNFPSNVRVIHGDLTMSDCPVDRFMEGCDVLMHCAGELHDEANMMKLHVDGTERLIQATLNEAIKNSKEIHWVQLSSVGAYGSPPEFAHVAREVAEDTLENPRGLYEFTKTQSDKLVMQAAKHGIMSYTLVRPSTIFAADMPNSSLRSLGAMIRRHWFFYIGPPGAVAAYVHADDVVRLMLLCAMDHRAKGKIYNISNDCSMEEMIEGMALVLGVPSPRLRLPEPIVRAIAHVACKITPSFPLSSQRIDALVRRTNYPYHKLQKELGFTPQISVPNAIGEVVILD